MIDPKPVIAASGDDLQKPAVNKPGDSYALLRQFGGRAYQLLAAARAADHFIAQEGVEDRDTGSWLISCAVGLAEELAADLDAMGRSLKAGGGDAAQLLVLQKVRARAHQLHAATRASDHFLEQDNNVDRSTGSWLIACALGLADKLANEIEDLANGMRRGAGDSAGELPAIRRAATATPLRSTVG